MWMPIKGQEMQLSMPLPAREEPGEGAKPFA
jgi:hypothetical protein